MLRRLLTITLITLSLLAGSFLLVGTAIPAISPTVRADGGPIPPPPPPPIWP